MENEYKEALKRIRERIEQFIRGYKTHQSETLEVLTKEEKSTNGRHSISKGT